MMKAKNILERFERYGVEHCFLRENMRIVIGVSGGADSLAMALLFLALRQKYALFLIVAHINYHLRGEESDADEQFVKEFCFERNVPLYILNNQKVDKQNLQKSARDMRMAYFRKLQKYYKMDYIALAHHSDDQCETVLHRLIRGAGFTGLGGIKPSKDSIIHPVLSFNKTELQGYLREMGIEPRIDKSNITDDYTRNKIRNRLLPLLRDEFNPAIEQKLLEYSRLFTLSDEYFVEIAHKEFKKNAECEYNHSVAFDIQKVNKQFPIVQYYLFREAWQVLTGTDKDFYTIHFDDIYKVVVSESGYKEVVLPNNVLVIKDYDVLIFRRIDRYTEPKKVMTKEIPTPRGIYTFNNTRYTLEVRKPNAQNPTPKTQNPVAIDLDKVVFPITLRYRKDGDKFIPLGMSNMKKLKDFFIDEKVPKLKRDDVVIWTDAEKVLWVSGYRIDQRVAVSDETKNILQIKMEQLEEKKSRSSKRAKA